MKPQINADQYFRPAYDTKGRFLSYWHQIDEVVSLKSDPVLEIGIGNSFVSNYLKERKVNVITVDIFDELNPDVVASVMELPYRAEAFPVVMCCEVLEHLPYEHFSNCLKELNRVSQKWIILSLPDVSPSYKFFIELPKIKRIKTIIPHPLPRLSQHEFKGEHYWEIGKSQSPLKKILNDIKTCGLEIHKTYRVYEYRHHRFFLLKKFKLIQNF